MKTAEEQTPTANTATPEGGKNMWRGPVELGLGIGSLGLLLKILNSSKRLERVESGKDEMVLRLPDDSEKGRRKDLAKRAADGKEASLDKEAFLIKALASTALAAGTIHAINQISNHIRMKRLEKDIDDLDRAHTEALIGMKEAGAREFFKEFVAKPSIELALITLLAGGAASYATLANSFPKKKKNLADRPGPKKIVIEGFGSLIPDGKPDGPLVSENAKSATVIEFGENDRIKASSLLAVALADIVKEAGHRNFLVDIACRPDASESAAELGSASILDSPSYQAVWDGLDKKARLEKMAAVLSDRHLGMCANLSLMGLFHDYHPEIAKASAALANHPEISPILVKIASIRADLDWMSAAKIG